MGNPTPGALRIQYILRNWENDCEDASDSMNGQESFVHTTCIRSRERMSPLHPKKPCPQDNAQIAQKQKCQQSQGSRGSWSRNPELSSLFISPRVFASQKCQQSQGSRGVVVAKPRTVVTFGLVSCLRVSKVSTVTGIAGVVVAKPRTVVTFGLVSCLRVSTVSAVTGIAGVVVAKPRTVVTFGLVSVRRGRETRNCRHFWTRLVSSRLKSVNGHRDRGGRGRETQNCRHF